MLKLVPKKQSYMDRMTEYMQTEEYSKLPTEEQRLIGKRVWASLIVRYKRELKRYYAELRKLSISRKKAIAVLKEVEEGGMDSTEIIDGINNIDELKDAYQKCINSTGKAIANLTPIWGTLFTNDDIRSLFNVSYKDMQEVAEGCTRGNIIEYLLMSWWAGDTVELFGQAMFDYMRSEPKIKKTLDDGFDDFLLSLEKPIRRYNVSYDRYGEVQTVEHAQALLKRIK